MLWADTSPREINVPFNRFSSFQISVELSFVQGCREAAETLD